MKLANTHAESNEFKCTGLEFLARNTADKPAVLGYNLRATAVGMLKEFTILCSTLTDCKEGNPIVSHCSGCGIDLVV